MTVLFHTTLPIGWRYLESKIQYPCIQSSASPPVGGELGELRFLAPDTSRCELQMTFFSRRPQWI